MATLNKYEKFDDYIRNKNFRPLVLSQRQIYDILRDRNFDKMGFYAVTLKTLNLAKPLLTLRYVLFNRSAASGTSVPYNFDGQPTSLASVSRHLKFRGFVIDHLGNTSYWFDRAKLHEIFRTTDASIPSKEESSDSIFVVFMLIDKTPQAPAPPPYLLNIDLEYEVIETWKTGGGGPGSTATSPAP